MAYIHIDLDDFDDDDLVEELQGRGYLCEKKVQVVAAGGLIELSKNDFEHIAHLHVCGQREAARNEALALVSGVIRRDLMN